MNNDAISRSAVIDRIAEFLGPKGLDEWEVMVAIRDIIENAPALDVAPVVHARWIPIKLYGGDHAIKCSACNNCDNPSKVPGRYCWQCGARMDGEA